MGNMKSKKKTDERKAGVAPVKKPLVSSAGHRDKLIKRTRRPSFRNRDHLSSIDEEIGKLILEAKEEHDKNQNQPSLNKIILQFPQIQKSFLIIRKVFNEFDTV